MGRVWMRCKPVCLVLVLLLALSGCSLPVLPLTDVPCLSSASADVVPSPAPTTPAAPVSTPLFLADAEVHTIPFGTIQYRRPDAQGLVDALEDAAADIVMASTGYDQVDIAEWVWMRYNTFDTMYTLAQIHLDEDAADPFWQEECAYFSSVVTAVDFASGCVYRALLDSPYRDELVLILGDATLANMERAVQRMDERIRPMLDEEEKLKAAYRQQVSTLEVVVDNQPVTLVGLDDVYDSRGYFAYMRALRSWFGQANVSLGNVYLQLVQLRQSMAHTLGYPSYTDLSYDWHGYDYLPEDVEKVRGFIKTSMVPLWKRLSQSEVSLAPDVNMDAAAFLGFLDALLPGMDAEMGAAFDFMQTYDLARLPGSMHATSAVYTTYLTDYDAPVIVCPWQNRTDNLLGFAHEFGHFFDAWQDADAYSSSTLDMAEVFSTGMEVLIGNHWCDVLDDAAAAQLQVSALCDLIYVYVSSVAFDDFEDRVYALPEDELALETINALYAQVSKEYGIASTGLDLQWLDLYEWVTVTHFYEAPFYTISYTAAADVSIQLWCLSQKDESSAVELYKQLISRKSGTSFFSMMAAAGLDTIFVPGRIAETAEELEEYLWAIGRAA